MRPLTALHWRRLRDVWRSAGWPCRDAIELDLLVAGLLHRHLDAQGRETLCVSDAGLRELAATLQRNRAAFDSHEALVARVALQMLRAGRVVWRGLKLRVPLPVSPGATGATGATGAPGSPAVPGSPPDHAAMRWVQAMPDVFSIRHTTVEDFVAPVAHEIKVRRADLLADLRRVDKGAAYLAMSSQCWYVLAAGIADADEIPATFGVMVADRNALTVMRPAPCRAMRLPFPVWMALARATAVPALHLDGQDLLAAMPGSVDAAPDVAPDVAVLAPVSTPVPAENPAALSFPPEQPMTSGAALPPEPPPAASP